MFKTCNNTVTQGNVGLGYAIAYYTKVGYTVSIPLNDAQKYDLIIEMNQEIYTVQVKTTKFKIGSNYQVQLKTVSGSTRKISSLFNEDKFIDFLFILTEDGTMYNIPLMNFENTSAVNLSSKFNEYKV